jgi:N-methylhydantoinase B
MTTAMKTVDPVTFEIISHRLHEVTKEVGATLERVGGTVNTTQLRDYMAALYTPNGDILSAGDSMGWHVACAGFAVKHIIKAFDGNIHADDVFLLNDPYVAAIHQSDVYIISPIHYEDEMVGWSATFVHVMDIGAMSPGGNSPGATEIFHEGVRVPGVKLVDRGVLQQDVFNLIINMTRQPTMVGLDLKCELAANNVAKVRLRELCTRYGTELIEAASKQLIAQSEAILRRRILEIPDGTWNDSAVIQANDTWRVKLELRKVGDRFFFDFAGTDDQANTGINLPYHATFGACYESVLVYLGYDIPKNQGVFAPLEVAAPLGSVVNVQYPGPVSLNTTSGGAIAKFLAFSVMAQCLATSEKWRGEAMAQTLGGRLARHAGVSQHGNYYVSTLLEVGGMGASSYKDGVDSGRGTTTCHNIEWVESNFPLLYLFRRHAQDSGGAGRFRGGSAVEVGMTVHRAPEEKIRIVALGVAGLKNSGRGSFGGYPGAPSLLMHYEQTKVNQLLSERTPPVDMQGLGGEGTLMPYTDFSLNTNDVLYIRTACGGGFGDPLEREPTLVLRDLRNGMLSPDVVHDVYGVVQSGDEGLDAEATEVRRADMKAERRKALK